jgi:hypothetical protein
MCHEQLTVTMDSAPTIDHHIVYFPVVTNGLHLNYDAVAALLFVVVIFCDALQNQNC